MATALIGLGSNQGDRAAWLVRAIERLEARPQVQICARSQLLETTAAGGPPEQGKFLNQVVRVETTLEPESLLAWLLEIERQLGRQRSQRWGPRAVDLDLLLYDDLVLHSPSLELPHPRMAYRWFVLQPAAEVAPQMLHPTTGWTIERLLEHLNTAPDYVALGGAVGAGTTELAQAVTQQAPARWIADPVDRRRLAGPSSAGLPAVEQLELLRRRVERLAERPDRVPQLEPGDWQISDFWLDESLVYARLTLSGRPGQQLLEAWQQARLSVMQPKLLVLLEASPGWLAEQIAGPEPSCGEVQALAEWLERWAEALHAQACRPDQGPVLRLDARDRQRAVQEVAAAVQAMVPEKKHP